VALYLPSLGHDFVIDDAYYIVDNDAVTRGAPLADYFLDRRTTASRADFQWQSYRPVRTIAFRAIVAAFGARPLPFGVVNLALYAACIALVAGLALRVAGDRAAALAATALWALMPVHVEPVAYASALGDQLSLVLQLLAIVAAARAIAQARLAAVAALASLVAAALAMGAKEMAVTEGPLLAAGVACAWRSLARDARRRAVLVLAAHAALTLGFLVLRTHVIGAVAQGAISALTMRIAARATPIFLWKYLAVIVAPLGHAAAYAAPSLARAHAAVAWLGVIAVAVALWRAHRPTLTFAAAWFALSLVPVLHVVPLLAYYADRFAYVPSVGVALAVAVALAAAGRWRRVAFVAAFALALVYAVAVPLEARAWRDEATLWRHAVDVAPDAALAQSNLGVTLLRAHAAAAALPHLEAAERLSGGGPATSMQIALALEELGRYDEAAAAAQKSLALADSPAGRAILARITAKAAAAAAAPRR
jgi:protein O-mannosyl-transferase